jgi:hypothetical protein
LLVDVVAPSDDVDFDGVPVTVLWSASAWTLNGVAIITKDAVSSARTTGIEPLAIFVSMVFTRIRGGDSRGSRRRPLLYC